MYELLLYSQKKIPKNKSILNIMYELLLYSKKFIKRINQH